jgi:membrane protein DedA with SNARE-associated domain
VSEVFWMMVWVFGALVGAGIGLPIPEEIPTVLAGAWVGSKPQLGLMRWLILPVCFLGVILSDVLLYFIGRRWGRRLLESRWLERFFPADKRAQTEENFHRYGIRVLLFIRWIPAIRSPMFVTAGLMRVPVLYFIAIDGLAAVLGHSLLFFLAYVFGEEFRSLVEHAEYTVGRYVKPLLILSLIVGLAVYLLVRFLRRPVSTGDPEELPLIGPRVAAQIGEENAARETKVPAVDKKEAVKSEVEKER